MHFRIWYRNRYWNGYCSCYWYWYCSCYWDWYCSCYWDWYWNFHRDRNWCWHWLIIVISFRVIFSRIWCTWNISWWRRMVMMRTMNKWREYMGMMWR